MSASEIQHLVKMANQIAANIGIGATEEDAVAKVEDHIKRFWARPMREKICAQMDDFVEELSPTATKALERIQAEL